jgi:hypothetical protein
MINGWSECQKRIKDGEKVPEGFIYASDTNENWMTQNELKIWMDENQGKIGDI